MGFCRKYAEGTLETRGGGEETAASEPILTRIHPERGRSFPQPSEQSDRCGNHPSSRILTGLSCARESGLAIPMPGRSFSFSTRRREHAQRMTTDGRTGC
jgi:hypothetical protein